MAHILLPAGRKWQVIAESGETADLDYSAETVDQSFDLGTDLAPRIVVDVDSGEVRELKDGDAWDAAVQIAAPHSARGAAPPMDSGFASTSLSTAAPPPASSSSTAPLSTSLPAPWPKAPIPAPLPRVPPPAESAARTAERSARMRPLVDDAMALLGYAVAAKTAVVDKAARDTIIAVNDAVARNAATVVDEQNFFDAYQAVSQTLAPVTAATLRASMQRLPTFASLFPGRATRFNAVLSGMTFGRFFHAVLFIFVLVLAAVALDYQATGSTALARYKSLNDDGAKVSDDLVKLQTTMLDKLALNDKAGPDPASVRAAAAAVAQVKDAIADKTAQRAQIDGERKGVPKTLAEWDASPCSDLRSYLLCIGHSAQRTTAKEGADAIESARTTLENLNRIVLPLLFGLLGACCSLLRTMSVEIRAQQFAPNSALHHITRLSLGALAGIAATWLLNVGQLGLASTTPLWVLAFVAGYGTELVFAFMDRIISAFKA